MSAESPTEQGADPSPIDNSELPSRETIRTIHDRTVLDKDGQAHEFGSLYSGPRVAKRVLVIFVRHFFCGSCQEFLRTLSESITPETLLPHQTSIAVIGCGDPGLIELYERETGCRFPIYADPTRQLYHDLGLVSTWDLGPQPDYIKKSMPRIVIESIVQALKHVPSGLAHKGGDSKQIGGEFLFEPVEAGSTEGDAAEKQVTWFHRMTTTRDHTEVPELKKVLGIST
ncbi:hypothetical protein P168DRAFT_317647 [Aspergillus campestris IBT 28561]|uniref:AhpC/TSA antioxidant enzyme-domain-containing protein n=1 Tax=Aspergillus campestris (strain IBT 28561) TaxID=1392248 RepID=A0A2I1D3Z2_ASPC2|nr:uncharacterized protein P168DRAFT_317647 [Aspergillus campestris IBT 28561]PKY04593.1 hypothetical protein P168DRAFT_317647 [Aspergillus campestris IBT 28561]